MPITTSHLRVTIELQLQQHGGIRSTFDQYTSPQIVDCDIV